MDKKYTESEMKAFVESLPYGVDGKDFKAGPTVARGHDEFMKYLKTRGRPKKDEKKEVVSLRLEPKDLKVLRKSKGWQTRLSRKVSEWVSEGAL
jgi:uncharacterized protein (DUF4415 family)